MRMNRWIHRVTSMLLMLVVIASTQPGTLILCVGPDGHIALEMGVGRCGPSSAGEHGTASGSCTEFSQVDTCCAPCADVPLVSQILANAGGSKERFELAQKSASLAAVVAPVASVVDGRTGAPTGHTLEPLPSAAGAQTDCILRC